MEQDAIDASYLIRAPPRYDRDNSTNTGYRAVPYRQMNWAAVDRDDRNNIPGIADSWNECQLCNLDQTPEEVEQMPALDILHKTAERSFAQMAPIPMCIMLRRMYEAKIQPNIDGKVPMRTRMFWMHIDEHAPTVTHMIESSLRAMNDQLRLLRSSEIFEEEITTGEMRISKSGAMLALKIEKERKPLLKMATEIRAIKRQRT